MADAQAKKFFGEIWGLAGDRDDPEDVGLDRSTGWPVRYEQPGADAEPERTVFNQLLCELDQAFSEKARAGVLEWDARIDYPGDDETGYAFVVGTDGRLYVSLRPSGPTTGNPTNPVGDGQTAWAEY